MFFISSCKTIFYRLGGLLALLPSYCYGIYMYVKREGDVGADSRTKWREQGK